MDFSYQSIHNLYKSEISGLTKKNKLIYEEPEYYCLYFSANWCPQFSTQNKVLKEFYNEVNKSKYVFEIFYINSDSNEKQFEESIENMTWLYFPYESKCLSEIEETLHVNEIPISIIINNKGETISLRGFSEIEEFGNKVLEHWNIPIKKQIYKEYIDNYQKNGKKIKLKCHKHSLIYCGNEEKNEIRETGWYCGECERYYDETVQSFYCFECDYNCCTDCFDFNIQLTKKNKF